MTTAPVQPPLSASGRYIVDAHGRRVRLAGVNWRGVANPGVLDILKALIPLRTGPGVS